MKICSTFNCENYVEGNTDRCASCNAYARKLEKDIRKQAGKVKPKAIAKVSEKRKDKLKIYKPLSDSHLIDHPECQAKLVGCDIQATCCHHSKGRIGDNLTDKESFISVCDPCHFQIHNVLSAAENRRLGFKR